MKRDTILSHEFVEYIPDDLKGGTIYVSMSLATAIHKCCCGCGREVVTPLSPTDWKLTFDGESISLHPSIGNWNYDCQSHYWIRGSKVKWASQWSREEIDAGRADDSLSKKKYFDRANAGMDEVDAQARKPQRSKLKRLWQKFQEWLT